MKKVSILFVSALALGLTFTSCSKDEDNSTTGSVEGKWNFSKMGGMAGTQEVLVDYPGNDAGCSKDYINLATDGAMTDVDYDSADSPCEAFTSTGTFTKTATTITVTIDGSPETVEILSLTSSELKVKDADGMITLFTRG